MLEMVIVRIVVAIIIIVFLATITVVFIIILLKLVLSWILFTINAAEFRAREAESKAK